MCANEIFDAIVKSNQFYDVVLWWSAMNNGRYRAMFEKVYRQVGLMITGSMRSTSMRELFTLLNWFPVDSTDRQMAVCSAARLDAGHSWSSRDYGHARILNHSIVPNGVDYYTPEPFFGAMNVAQ